MTLMDSLLQGDFPEKYNWSSEYEVGVPLIDAQHKKLFLIFKNLADSCRQAEEGDGGVQALSLMADYVGYHFNAEEAFWRLDPTIYTAHRKAHYNFVREVYMATGKVQKQEDITDELLQFLGDWLLNHVLGMDRDHFQQLRDNGLVDADGLLKNK